MFSGLNISSLNSCNDLILLQFSEAFLYKASLSTDLFESCYLQILNILYVNTVLSRYHTKSLLHREVDMAKSAFIEGVRREIRLRNYSIRTEKAYLFWIKRYIRFHGLRHPREMAGEEVKQFLSWLANEQDVSANTQ